VWCFDGQFSLVAAKNHFAELKQKRVWMEAFELGKRFALQPERRPICYVHINTELLHGTVTLVSLICEVFKPGRS